MKHACPSPPKEHKKHKPTNYDGTKRHLNRITQQKAGKNYKKREKILARVSLKKRKTPKNRKKLRKPKTKTHESLLFPHF